MSTRPRILVLASYYLPAFKAGGPVRSLAGMISHLGDTFEFFVIASDRDLGDACPFPGISADGWNQCDKTSVRYVPNGKISHHELRKIYQEINPDIVYLCGGFSPIAIKFLMLRRLGLVPRDGVVLAPQGVFASSALQFKSLKKGTFFRFANLVRLYENLNWHVTSEAEQADLTSTLKRLGAKANSVLTAPQFFVGKSASSESRPFDRQNALRVTFLARICRVKNLLGALEILKGVNVAVEFNIYGPVEDSAYWDNCQTAMACLPRNISALYRGTVNHDDVYDVFTNSDLLLFPTFGENFGHVILESMQSGCPVLISDKTAFTNLEPHRAGWDLPLDNVGRFRDIIHALAAMDAKTRIELSKSTLSYAASLAPSRELKQQFESFLYNAFRVDCPRYRDAA